MPRYSFKIDPCPPEEGYGWVLRYFEDDWEIPGYELFLTPEDVEWMKEVEFDNARFSGELWVKEMSGKETGEDSCVSSEDVSSSQLKLDIDF